MIHQIKINNGIRKKAKTQIRSIIYRHFFVLFIFDINIFYPINRKIELD